MLTTKKINTARAVSNNAMRSGHVTLLRAEFQPLKLSPQSDLRRRVISSWALPQIFIFILNSPRDFIKKTPCADRRETLTEIQPNFGCFCPPKF